MLQQQHYNFKRSLIKKLQIYKDKLVNEVNCTKNSIKELQS